MYSIARQPSSSFVSVAHRRHWPPPPKTPDGVVTASDIFIMWSSHTLAFNLVLSPIIWQSDRASNRSLSHFVGSFARSHGLQGTSPWISPALVPRVHDEGWGPHWTRRGGPPSWKAATCLFEQFNCFQNSRRQQFENFTCCLRAPIQALNPFWVLLMFAHLSFQWIIIIY